MPRIDSARDIEREDRRKEMKVLSLFTGIGAFEKALDRLEVPYELLGFSEIDKYAVKSYCAIHNVDESLNLGDITKIDETKLPKDIDLITYGFPCQDISLAGKLKGLFNEDGTQTRSGLFFEALRIIEETQPMVAIAENVKNLTSKKFSEQFKIVLDSLEEAGYNNYWKVLNAKDFGIPQNRERVFIVSIRKDVDTGIFQSPEGFPLELRLKDMLENEVDERFFISSERSEKSFENIQTHKHFTKGTNYTPFEYGVSYFPGNRDFMKDGIKEICPSLLARDYKDPKCVYVKEATKRGIAEAFEGDSINLEQPNSKTRRGRVGHGVAQTLTTSPQQAVIEPDKLRIRKLTPKECFRLMGFDDSDFEKAEAVNSNTQLYKQAGNSIVVPVIEHIIKALLECGALEREEKEMELKVQTPTFPEVIEFNFEELKQEITSKASKYTNLVYTEEQIPDAKKDRATLNKFVKALSDERIKVKKECLKPYEDFEAKIKELDGIVGEAIRNIDGQVKTFEETKKKEKEKKIHLLIDAIIGNTSLGWLTHEQIWNDKWLNASVSIKSIQDEINEILAKIENDLVTLGKMPEIAFEAIDEYKRSLDLNKAIAEGQRLADIQKFKEEQKQAEVERLKADEKLAEQQPPKANSTALRQWLGFKAYLTVEDAQQLAEFFRNREIEFEQINL